MPSSTQDISIDIYRVLQNPLNELSVLFPHIPGWGEIKDPKKQITVERISGAMTNLVFLASLSTTHDTSNKVIIRVFGSSTCGSLLFSRHQERGIFLAASILQLGPQCLVEFSNGRVEQFLPGETSTALSMRSSEKATAIAIALATFHKIMMKSLPLIRQYSYNVNGDSPRTDESGERNALWERLSDWLKVAVGKAPHSITTSLGISLETTGREIAQFQKYIEQDGTEILKKSSTSHWLAVVHNDLQYGNIVLNRQQGPGTITATLIDYEYCTVGDIAFDIANHFCEYAANYHNQDDPNEVLDWRKLPSAEQQVHFCEAYCACRNLEAQRDSELTKDDNQSYDVDGLLRRVHAYMPLSHLLWGLWGIIQSTTSHIEWDYIGYAQQRLQQYHRTKYSVLFPEQQNQQQQQPPFFVTR